VLPPPSGKHATWDGVDDESRTKIDEDRHMEEEKPRKITTSLRGVAPLRESSTGAMLLAPTNPTCSNFDMNARTHTHQAPTQLQLEEQHNHLLPPAYQHDRKVVSKNSTDLDNLKLHTQALLKGILMRRCSLHSAQTSKSSACNCTSYALLQEQLAGSDM
jgi:hypothetical protein